MSEPGQNKVDGTKSMPCIELTSPILDASSEHSFASYKSFNTTYEQEIQRNIEIRPNVKALIDKHKSFQENLLINAKVNDLKYSDQKLFYRDCEHLSTPDNDCIQMKGDTKQLENVQNVNNHVFETYTVHQMAISPKPLDVEKHVVSNSENTDFKTGMPKRFWQNIISLVNINNTYYQCLKQITDTQKFENIEDLMVHINLALKMAGDEFELIGSELIASSNQYLEKFGIILDSKLNEKLKRVHPSSNNDSTMNALRMELAENKRCMKIAENSIAQLQKEKKDLLNILISYDSENINKVSLEKRLEAQKQTNDELRDLISKYYIRCQTILNY
ncbi:PREDICTED: uncharacterized protein LOC107167069 [Diuraphis noxia]|uniref:uncharacterized protein LOC107167069 n=1 Tax=Diuraphis noxia TaxID=143948 RepID=UPI000763B29F|nr:PREDICTED: uncharacterized protein LOC107167069 [Diuraphis noxia]